MKRYISKFENTTRLHLENILTYCISFNFLLFVLVLSLPAETLPLLFCCLRSFPAMFVSFPLSLQTILGRSVYPACDGTVVPGIKRVPW